MASKQQAWTFVKILVITLLALPLFFAGGCVIDGIFPMSTDPTSNGLAREFLPFSLAVFAVSGLLIFILVYSLDSRQRDGAIILGLLLLVFGGGFTLILVGLGWGELQSMLADIPSLLTVWVPLGLLPMAGGLFLFRWGLKRDREKRRKAATEAAGPKEEQQQ